MVHPRVSFHRRWRHVRSEVMGASCCASSDVAAKQNDVTQDSQGQRPERNEELVPQVAGKVQEWTVKLVKGDGSKLGIDVDLTENSRLMIEQVNKGLVADWNKANSGKEVKPGDRIMSVNGTKDDAGAMAAVCQESQTLELLIRRE